MTNAPLTPRARTACPFCGSVENDYRFSERGYDLLACRGCELLFINPYGTSAEVFERVATYQYSDLTIVGTQKHYENSRFGYEAWYPRIAEACATATSVLDVGCGTGYLLEQLKHLPNLRRVGLELNTDRAVFAAEKAGCPVYQEPIETFKDADGFDVVILMDVVSHIPGFDFFAAARRLLRPGGRLLLKTGECASDVRKADLHDWQIPDHLHFLGLSTIDRIAERYGYEIRTHERIPASQELFAPANFHARGRSAFRNAIKRGIVAIPGALPVLAKLYDVLRGRRIYTSFIALSPSP